MPTDNVKSILDFGQLSSSTIGADGFGLISYIGDGGLSVAHCDSTECARADVAKNIAPGFSRFQQTDITIGADGLGLIVQSDDSSGLSVSHCDDVACTSATTSTIDSDGYVGVYSSITIGADGLGLISYSKRNPRTTLGYDLKVAHCDNAACTSATITTLVSDFVGTASITTGADGLGLISYVDANTTSLKIAHCDDAACTSATTTTFETDRDILGMTSITTGADGLGLFTYQDITDTPYQLPIFKVGHCDNAACTSATITTIDLDGRFGGAKITTGADGLGLISYFDSIKSTDESISCSGYCFNQLKVAHCDNTACTSVTTFTIDVVEHDYYGPMDRHMSVTIGADGLPMISFRDFRVDDPQSAIEDELTPDFVAVIHCGNAFCESAFKE